MVVSEQPAFSEGQPEGTPKRLPQHSLTELLLPLSSAIDLAEGREPGHARRVGYIALTLAEALDLEMSLRLACLYAGLFHDVGVLAAGAGLANMVRGDERLIFANHPLLSPTELTSGVTETPDALADHITDHVIHGARAAQALLLPQEAIRGISSHHENWDGSGYPHGLRGEEISVVGRIVSLADQTEAMLSQADPLLARRNSPVWLNQLSGRSADPAIAGAMRGLTNSDQFWWGMHAPDLSAELTARSLRLQEPKGPRVTGFSEAFAELVDARFSFTAGISSRVARYAAAIGETAGLSRPHLGQLRLAALLHDVGQVAVSERIMAKPGILTIDELEVMRLHPLHSREIIAAVSGLEQVAQWAGSHHEWVDGRGYPEGRAGEEIPLESRILAVADTYVALTSDRPYRPRHDDEEVQRRLASASGTQLDAVLVELLLERVLP